MYGSLKGSRCSKKNLGVIHAGRNVDTLPGAATGD